MSENISKIMKRQFLTVWSILNLCGWIVGFFFVFLILSDLEYDYRFSAWKTFLSWLPMGASIGLFQWFKLRQLGINVLVWIVATALGGSIVVTLYSWVLNFGSFDYRAYNIPSWIINIGLAMVMPVGGTIIGGLQSIFIREHVSKVNLWVRAYVLGLLLPPIIIPLSLLIKSFFLRLLYSIEFIDLVDLRWLLFFGFLVVITVMFISILTGNILLKYSSLNSVTIKTG